MTAHPSPIDPRPGFHSIEQRIDVLEQRIDGVEVSIGRNINRSTVVAVVLGVVTVIESALLAAR